MAQKKSAKPAPGNRAVLAVLSVAGIVVLAGLVWWVVGGSAPGPRPAAAPAAEAPKPTPAPENRENEEAAARLIWQVQSRMQTRDYSAAEALLEEASALAPDLPMVHLALAGYYNTVRRTGDGLAEARRALELDPDSDMAQFQIGLSAFGEGRYADAIEDFDQALVMNATSPLYFYQRALAWQLSGRPEEALASISWATLDRMDAPQLFDLRGRLRLDAGQYAGALADWERVLAAMPANESAAGMKGVALARVGRRQEALPWLQRGLKMGADDSSQLFAMAENYMKSGDVERASRTLAQAVALREFIEKRDRLIEVVAERPGDATSYYNLAHHYLENQRSTFADGVFHRALALDPRHADSLRDFGALRVSMRDFDYGFRLLEQYLEERPGDLEQRRSMGETYEMLQRPQEGFEVMRGFPDGVRPDITYWQLLRRLKREAGIP